MALKPHSIIKYSRSKNQTKINCLKVIPVPEQQPYLLKGVLTKSSHCFSALEMWIFLKKVAGL